MAKQSLNGVLQHLHKLAAVQTYREFSDRNLLERFALAHDEAAFTVLIERHGPMVLGVCRRALPNCHDAEDACQATFLILARKAVSVRQKASLSSWLHGVACRVAVNLKREHARRKSRERKGSAPTPKDPAAEVTWREVQAILDEELEQLPERYRAPLILCYLECLTRDEAAQQLGLSSGSLHGRLERARDLLRQRLTKRGLTLAGVMSAAAVGESVAQAALAPTFVVSSTRAALLLAAGQPLTESVVATNVLALAQEVLKTMFLTKVKLGTAAVLCAGLVMAMIGGSLTSLSIAQDSMPKTAVVQALAVLNGESDEDFIRRISKDLRGTEPSPTEIHFFVTSKDAGRRQTLIDLFIQERQAKKQADAKLIDLFQTSPYSLNLTTNLVNVSPLSLNHATATYLVALGADNDKIERELLQGAWTLVEAHRHGKKVAAKDLPTKDLAHRPHQLVIGRDGKVAMRHKDGGENGTFELDTTKKPKEITINWLIQWPAIYKLEGNTLTICFNCDANLPRPDEFRTLADSDRLLFVYERAKKEK